MTILTQNPSSVQISQELSLKLQDHLNNCIEHLSWQDYILNCAEQGLNSPHHPLWLAYLDERQRLSVRLEEISLSEEESEFLISHSVKQIHSDVRYSSWKIAQTEYKISDAEEPRERIRNILGAIDQIWDFLTLPQEWDESLVEHLEHSLEATEKQEWVSEDIPAEELTQPPAPAPQASTSEPTPSDVDDMFEQNPTVLPLAMRISKSPRKVNKPKEYTGKARPSKRLVVTEGAKDLFDSLLIGFKENTKHAFYHIYSSSGRILITNDGWVPFPIAFQEKYFKKGRSRADVKGLVEKGLLECDNHYSMEEGKALCYRIPQDLLLQASDVILNDMSAGDVRRYDMVKGKYVKAAPKHCFTIGERGAISQLTRERIEGYSSPVVFDRAAMFQVVQQKRLALNSLTKGTKDYSRQLARYMSDYHAYKSIVLDGAAVSLPDGMAVYCPAYEAQHSGRITHLKGGFQSASRDLTAAAFRNIEEYNNYDLVGAQSRIAKQIMAEFGFNCEWLHNYTMDKKAKHHYAKLCFPDICMLSPEKAVQAFKDMLHAMLMGTRIRAISPATNKSYKMLFRLKQQYIDGKAKSAPVLEAHVASLFKLYGGDAEKAYAAYVRFYDNCKPLIDVLTKFHAWIKDIIKGKVVAPSWVKRDALGRTSVNNKMDMPLSCAGLGSSLVAKVVAHLLQGAEARWMTELIKLAPKHGYTMLEDFHDGALIKGLVPEEAQREATALSGIEGILEIKAFI